MKMALYLAVLALMCEVACYITRAFNEEAVEEVSRIFTVLGIFIFIYNIFKNVYHSVFKNKNE